MPALAVSPLYAALVALLMAALSMRVGMLRGVHSVALGDGDVAPLRLAIRRFGNLSEYAAAALLLLVLMELQGVAPRWLHAYGATLLALRVLHAATLFDDMAAPLWRKAGRFLSAGGQAALLVAGALAMLL